MVILKLTRNGRTKPHTRSSLEPATAKPPQSTNIWQWSHKTNGIEGKLFLYSEAWPHHNTVLGLLWGEVWSEVSWRPHRGHGVPCVCATCPAEGETTSRHTALVTTIVSLAWPPFPGGSGVMLLSRRCGSKQWDVGLKMWKCTRLKVCLIALTSKRYVAAVSHLSAAAKQS